VAVEKLVAKDVVLEATVSKLLEMTEEEDGEPHPMPRDRVPGERSTLLSS
jgi:hypothetical protein